MKKILLSLTFLVGSIAFGQQVIGEFPVMDGGIEGQEAGNLSSQGSSAKDTPSTTWSISSTGGTTDEAIIENADEARTGSFSLRAQLNNDKDNARVQAPSSVGENLLTVETKYTVQFFYKTTEVVADENLKPGIYLNNTSGGKTTNKIDVATFKANTWGKAYGTVTTGDTFNTSNWAQVRLGGEKGVDKPLVYIDDFVVYAGDYDDVAPASPADGVLGLGDVSWSAPVDGVDNGGYVLVKYTGEVDAEPNQNGIYAVGSSIGTTGTVVYIGTDVSFSDAEVGTMYKVYTVDKAFNYSAGLLIEDSTASTANVLASKFNVYPNPTSGVVNISSSDVALTSVQVYNTLGKQVYASSSVKESVNVSSFAKGIYFLKLNADGASTTKKLIVE